MAANTSKGITYPTSGDAISPLETVFATMANTTNTAIAALDSTVSTVASHTSSISTLTTNVSAINTRLALNLQTSAGTPSGVPANSGPEGTMHWDSTNNILYIYNTGAWKAIYGNTSWINITINSGFVASGAVPQYRIVGDIVYVRGAFSSTGFTAGTAGACGQLPVSAYPTTSVIYSGATNSATALFNKVSISGSGTISITPESASTTNYITFSYPLG